MKSLVVQMIQTKKALISLVILINATTAWAGEFRCNTRGGYVANQPEVQERGQDSTGALGNDGPEVEIFSDIRQNETIPIDLSKLESLVGFEGRYTTGVPILGIRIENYPTFDPKKDCNRVQVQLVKPKLEELSPGKWRASVENARFVHEFTNSSANAAWVQDIDAANRFFWIFPKQFGRTKRDPWRLSEAYDQSYRAAPFGSAQRRWIAEAYLSLALRSYRIDHLKRSFPEGGVPTRDRLHQSFRGFTEGICNAESKQLLCAATDLIEMNEAAHNGEKLSPDAFRTGDALLENSGISTGLRQLDFASSNDQAAELGPRLSKILYTTKRGYGLLRPIRMWEADFLSAWYMVTGAAVNRELSRNESKELLLQSHVQFIVKSVGTWGPRIDKLYPGWSRSERAFLTLVAIDLENVTGYKLFLDPEAPRPCAVLDLRSTAGRSNSSVAAGQARRIKNASLVAQARFGRIDNLSCIAL